MSFRASSIDGVDDFVMGLNLPKDFFFFKIKNGKFSLQISKAKTGMRRRTSCKSSTFDASRILNGRNDFELSFGQLMNLN